MQPHNSTTTTTTTAGSAHVLTHDAVDDRGLLGNEDVLAVALVQDTCGRDEEDRIRTTPRFGDSHFATKCNKRNKP